MTASAKQPYEPPPTLLYGILRSHDNIYRIVIPTGGTSRTVAICTTEREALETMEREVKRARRTRKKRPGS